MKTINKYMLIISISLLSVFSTKTSWGQNRPIRFDDDAMQTLYQQKIRIQKQALLTLTGFSSASILSGGIGFPLSEGRWQAFHRMNFSWGLINMAIAAPAWIQYRKETKKPLTSAEMQWKSFRALENAWLFNMALDVSYVVAGGWLWETSRSRTGDTANNLLGFGQSMILQGGMLLLYDAVYYARLQKAKRIQQIRGF